MERRAGWVPPGERAGLPAAARARRGSSSAGSSRSSLAPTSACRSSAGGWRSAASRPATSRSLEDLARLPFTVKTDLRDTYPFGLFASPMEEIVRLHASSGTTGKPIVVAYTEADLRVWTSVMVRTLRRLRPAPRRRDPERLRLRPLHRRPGRALRRRGARRHGHPHLRRQHRAAAHGAAGLRGHRHLLHALATCSTSSSAPARRGSRSSGSRWASSAPSPGSRRCAATSRRTPASAPTTSTASPRSSAPGVGIECERRDGLHLFEDHFYPEIIDPDTGEVLPDGAEGELVLTTLSQGGDADDPLPHARHHGAHPRALRLRPDRAPHPPHRPALRRHAHHPRRERVPVADRDRAPRRRGDAAALPDRPRPRARASTRWRCRWR